MITDQDRALFKIDDSLFFAKLERMPNGCLEWLGSRVKDKYGRVTRRGLFFTRENGAIETHRYALYLATGSFPSDKTLHHCDNPPCCDPTHLFEGSAKDNTQDRVSKGRFRLTGTNNPKVKLRVFSNEIIEAVQKSQESGVMIAERFGMSTAYVSLLRNKKRRLFQ